MNAFWFFKFGFTKRHTFFEKSENFKLAKGEKCKIKQVFPLSCID